MFWIFIDKKPSCRTASCGSATSSWEACAPGSNLKPFSTARFFPACTITMSSPTRSMSGLWKWGEITRFRILRIERHEDRPEARTGNGLLQIGDLMLWKKNAKSMQSQLALRRINRRRTTELSSTNWVLPESETNKWFPIKSHCHALSPITDTEVLSNATEFLPETSD